jgi:hypothetical protein
METPFVCSARIGFQGFRMYSYSAKQIIKPFLLEQKRPSQGFSWGKISFSRLKNLLSITFLIPKRISTRALVGIILPC